MACMVSNIEIMFKEPVTYYLVNLPPKKLVLVFCISRLHPTAFFNGVIFTKYTGNKRDVNLLIFYDLNQPQHSRTITCYL